MSARAVCLDASVLVKSRVQEPHSDLVRAWLTNEPVCYTTPFCFYEALNIFKSKWKYQGQLTASQYSAACSSLITWFGGISRAGFVNDPDLTSPEAYRWVRDTVQSSGLDFSGAYQIYSVKHGYFQHSAGDSATVLATTDRALANVARQYSLKVIDLCSDSEPR
jgi:predicted nucleic acid-binding protein